MSDVAEIYSFLYVILVVSPKEGDIANYECDESCKP
jgi:hypothetical protein